MAERIPREFIDDLISRFDIVNYIDSYVKLKKRGVNYIASCPFHQEKTPSFTVMPNKQFYKCFGCGESGNIISFIMRYENASFVETIELLAMQAGVPMPTGSYVKQENFQPLYELMEKVSQFYQQFWQTDAAASAIAYLKNRGLSGEIAKRFGLGLAPNGWDHLIKHFPDATDMLVRTGMVIQKPGKTYDRFRDRIMYPIRDRRGRVIGFGGRVLGDEVPKYLNSPETDIFHKGRELYGLYEALKIHRSLPQCVIVEGYMDVLALAQHGIDYACATLGTATTADHLRMIMRHTHNVTFCFDGDTAGRKAAIRALENSLSVLRDGVHIRFMFLPDGEDPDSLIRQEGQAAFEERLQKAPSLSTVLFEHLLQNIDLTSLEGKAQLADAAAPLLQKIPMGNLRQLYTDELSRMVKIPSEQLMQNLQTKAKTPAAPKTPEIEEQPAPQLSLNSTLRTAIALLIQFPAIANAVAIPETFRSIEASGVKLLVFLYDEISQKSTITPAAILERWRNHRYFPTIQELASWDCPLDESEVMTEFKASLARIFEQNNARKVQNLLKKANLQGLTNEEKQTLQTLIRDSKLNTTHQET